MSLQMRKAFESDKQAISDVVITAFGDVQGQEIVDLITGLLADPSAQPLLSLVVTADDNVVGHVLFTNARIKHSQRIVSSAILAPLSVRPEYQNQGIGGQLIKEGLKQLKAAGVENLATDLWSRVAIWACRRPPRTWRRTRRGRYRREDGT